MRASPLRRPPAPTPAERARSILARGGPGTVSPTAAEIEPVMFADSARHVHLDGYISMLVADDHPLVLLTQQSPAGFDVLAELADVAPVPLREPVRGLLWITGRLSLADAAEARRRALRISETDPDERLLDVGHGVAMVLLRPTLHALVDGDGTHALEPDELATAHPDPFSRWETAWLCHLDQDHPDVLNSLSRHVPQRLRRGVLRPLSVDRLGLRLRVETESGDHDLRLAFERPVHTPADLSVEIRKLVGCPFLRRYRDQV